MMKAVRCLLLLALVAVYSAVAAASDPVAEQLSSAVQTDADLSARENPSEAAPATQGATPTTTRSTTATSTTTTSTTPTPRLSGPAVGSAVIATDPVGVFLTLAFIIAIILLAAWLLRRVGPVSIAGGGQSIRILAATSIGAREKILVIDVAGQQELIGVAPGRISHLHHYDQAVIDINADQNTNFSSKLKQMLDVGQRGVKP